MLRSSLFGKYTVTDMTEIPSPSRVAIIQSFGTSRESGSNVQLREKAREIAKAAFSNCDEKMVIFVQAPETTFNDDDEIHAFAQIVALESRPSTATGKGTTSEELFKMAQKKSTDLKYGDLQNTVVLAQAFHIGRLAVLAQKMNLGEIIAPKNLPREFDSKSAQKWTRNHARWMIREVPYEILIALGTLNKRLKAQE